MLLKLVFGYSLQEYAQGIMFCKENNAPFLETLSSLHNCVGKVATLVFPQVVHSHQDSNQFLK